MALSEYGKVDRCEFGIYACYEWVVPLFILEDVFNVYAECFGDKVRGCVLVVDANKN